MNNTIRVEGLCGVSSECSEIFNVNRFNKTTAFPIANQIGNLPESIKALYYNSHKGLKSENLVFSA